jgi:predicted signal transduction protein with EAL and GGDEF domain
MQAQDPALSSTEMLKRADLALYDAKRAGKATLSIYTPDMSQAEALSESPAR